MAWYDNTSKKSMTREYKSQGELDRDLAKAAEHGWSCASVTQLQQRVGCMRILMTGFLALIWKPKPRLLAVFVRQ